MSSSTTPAHRSLSRSAVLLGAAAFLAVAGIAGAGQPKWSTLKNETFVIRYHTTTCCGVQLPEDEATSGIWDFDPLTGAYRRLRPFHYNARFNTVIDGPGADGRGSYLATMTDRLVFEAWPSIIEFDAASLRIVRRTPMFAPPQDYFGWAVQGPIIDSGLSATTGLPEGIYGFVQCLYGIISNNGGWGQIGCQPTLFPGYDEPIKYSENEVFFRRSMEHGSTGLSALLELNPSTQEIAPVAFDPGRQGFWLGTKTTLSFYPVVDGGLGDSTETFDLTKPPIEAPGSWLHALFYHPTRKFFLLRWTDADKPTFQRLSILSDDLSRRLTDDVVGEPGAGAPPITFAAFAEDLPAEKVQTIPIVAHTPGKNGTFWTSDLYLYNPSADPVTVSIRRVTKPDETKTVDLPGHGSRTIPDVLSWAGGGPEGDGVDHDALVLTTPYRWGDNLVAAARVWTPDSDPELRARGGTMGQAVPAVPGTVGYSNHLPWEGELANSVYPNQMPFIRNATLILDYRQPGRFRHNLGVVNDDDEPLTVRLTWDSAMTYLYRGVLDEDSAAAQRSFEVPAHSVKVVNVDTLFPAELRDNYFPRVWVVADRPAPIWFSMVDNTTGDAVFVPYTLFDQLGDDFTRAAVPAVAHLPGRNGTFWQTDLYSSLFREDIVDDPQRFDRPQCWFHPSDPETACGGVTGEISQEILGVLPMDPVRWHDTVVSIHYPLFFVDEELWGWRNIYPDLIHRFDACAGDDDVRGGFEMKEGSWMGAYTRTYTTRADGGTYGGMLPLYPPHGWPVQHFAGLVVSPAFRINVGLYNGDADHAIVHRLTLYDAAGTKVAERELTLKPWANLIEPLEKILGLPEGSLAGGVYGLTVLPLDDEANGIQGRSWAFVSLVDNVTGDSTNWW